MYSAFCILDQYARKLIRNFRVIRSPGPSQFASLWVSEYGGTIGKVVEHKNTTSFD